MKSLAQEHAFIAVGANNHRDRRLSAPAKDRLDLTREQLPVQEMCMVRDLRKAQRFLDILPAFLAKLCYCVFGRQPKSAGGLLADLMSRKKFAAARG